MRKMNIKVSLLSLAMLLSCFGSSMSHVSALTGYDSLDSDEKSAFHQVFQETNDRKLKSVNVSYSTEISGEENISNYHWTAWYKTKKGDSINKKANSGKGIGSGSYTGFTKKKIETWSQDDKYIQGIKSINNGKFPSSKDYQFPVDTSTSKLDWWVDKPGYYDIMSDPKYNKIILKGYRTFQWCEEIKKTEYITNSNKITVKNVSNTDASFMPGGNGQLLYQEIFEGSSLDEKTGMTSQEFIQLINDSKKIHNEDKDDELTASKITMETSCYIQKNNKKTRIYVVVRKVDGQYNIELTYHIQETKVSFEIKEHTTKQQIAETVVAKNAYASEIQRYSNFGLVKKFSGAKNIQIRNIGFWRNINPYYHGGNTTTQDVGNYDYTFSTNGEGLKTINLYISLPVKYKLFTNIKDSFLIVPGLPNPSEDGDNTHNKDENITKPDDNENQTNPDKNYPLKPNDDDSKPSNPNKKPDNSDNTNPEQSNNDTQKDPSYPSNIGDGKNHNYVSNGNQATSIGDINNAPMVNIGIDAKDNGGDIESVRVPMLIHLFDINKVY